MSGLRIERGHGGRVFVVPDYDPTVPQPSVRPACSCPGRNGYSSICTVHGRGVSS